MIKIIFLIAAAALISQDANAANSAPQPSKKYSQYPEIVVEPDQTDIFAIPLDEDAQDQQEELERLEHPNFKK